MEYLKLAWVLFRLFLSVCICWFYLMILYWIVTHPHKLAIIFNWMWN